MEKKLLKDRYLRLVLLISVFLIFIFIPLFWISIPKTIVLILSVFLWFGLYIYTKNILTSSFLYTLFVLPFNLSIQLPYTVEIFNTEILLSNPFVDGLFVNYLVPTIFIVDLGILLMFFSVIKLKGFKGFWSEIKNIRNGFLFLFLFLIFHSFFHNNLVTTLYSLRIFILFLTVYFIKDLYGNNFFKRSLIPYSIIYIPLILFQGILGFLQVSRGSSLGLYFLGESKVVSGMQGSSFINLAGELYLRAYGTFPHPNVFAGFLVLFIILGLMFFENRKSLVGFSLVTISFVSLLFTFSRVAILLSLLFMGVFFLRYFYRKKFILSNSPLLLVQRFENLFKGDSSFVDRENLFRVGLKIFQDNWLLGVGGGVFVSAMESMIPRSSKGILIAQPVHNIFVLFVAEFGLLGLLFFIYPLIFMVLRFYKGCNIWKFFGVIFIIAIGMFDHYLISLPQGLVLLMVLFLMLIEFDSI